MNFEFFFIMDWVGKRTAVSILSVVLFLWNWLRERNILTSNLISDYCIRYTYVMYFLIRTRKGGSKRTLKNFFFFTKKIKTKKRKEIFSQWSGRKFPILKKCHVYLRASRYIGHQHPPATLAALDKHDKTDVRTSFVINILYFN